MIAAARFFAGSMWFVLLPEALLCGVLPGAAQTPDSSWKDWEYIRHSSVALASGRALGLSSLPVAKMSAAGVYIKGQSGRFVNFYESDRSRTAGAFTESYHRLNSRVVFHGKVGYENFSGRNMTGSAFIDPYRYPLDIDDYTANSAGAKKLERYQLTGGVGSRIGSRWILGGKVQYEAANYTKVKDLRHINKLLDMELSAEAGYRITDHLMAGAGYEYQRRVESVGFGIYGNTDRQYLSLINFGSFYGRAELHSDNGYTSETTPAVDFVHTLGLYAAIDPGKKIRSFHRLSYGFREGYFGVQATSRIVYTEHDGRNLGYEGAFSLREARALHYMRVRFVHETLANHENVFRRETSPGGNSAIVYYGQSKVLSRDMTTAGLEYTAHLGVEGLRSRWALTAGGDYRGRLQTVSLYPFYRKQEINSLQLRMAARRDMTRLKNRYTWSLATLFGTGGGVLSADGLYAQPSASQRLPASGDTYLQAEYEYLTQARVGGSLGAGYSYLAGKDRVVSLMLHYTYTRAFDTVYTGSDAHHAHVTAGLAF